MSNSVHKYRGNMAMEWMPGSLLLPSLRNVAAWAQHVKQIIMLTAGIETKSQEEMTKATREHFMLQEYNNWRAILAQKYPNASVLPYLEYTTGTKTAKVNGAYLYRNFQEGLRMFHNRFNGVWAAVLKEGISGKSKCEIWTRFCCVYHCAKTGEEKEESTPANFYWQKIERQKWVYAYKHAGPCCELLELGTGVCHEFLSSPDGLALRGTGSAKRKADKLGRAVHRETKVYRMFCMLYHVNYVYFVCIPVL